MNFVKKPFCSYKNCSKNLKIKVSIEIHHLLFASHKLIAELRVSLLARHLNRSFVILIVN